MKKGLKERKTQDLGSWVSATRVPESLAQGKCPPGDGVKWPVSLFENFSFSATPRGERIWLGKLFCSKTFFFYFVTFLVRNEIT